LSVFRSTHRPKRLLKKPQRFETTSSEEEIKTKKYKHIDEEKTKKKVSTTLQNIRNTINDENVSCNSNFNNSKSTATKVRIISDEIYQNPIKILNAQIKETYNQNQKYNQVSYHSIPLSRQNFNNTEQNTTNNFAKNM